MPQNRLLLKLRREMLKSKGVTPASVMRRQLRDIPEPRGEESRYRAQMLQMQKDIEQEIRHALKTNTAIYDVNSPDASRQVFQALQTKVLGIAGAMFPFISTGTARDMEAFNYKKYDSEMYRVLNLNGVLTKDRIDNMLRGWVIENTRLITNTNEKQLTRIQSIIMEAARSGRRAENLRKEISDVYGGTRTNVRTIARDQVGKLYYQLDKAKNEAAGITHYFWRTSQDERVRTAHAEREGHRYSWKSPPADGNPGQPINCRCTAEPDVESILYSGKELSQIRAEREEKTREARKTLFEKMQKAA